MRPIVTPEEMAAIDAAAPDPVAVLVDRAGAAVARAARRLLGGTYGRRVVVVAGKGNNGADGRAAARRLRATGIRTVVIEASDHDRALPRADLVIDAAYGTGFRGEYEAPDPAGAPVLAVDIPSGVDGVTGEVRGRAVTAGRTITFAALKPGLLLQPGQSHAGEVQIADIGLDVSSARAFAVDEVDVAAWSPPRPVDAHKWKAAVLVVGGSPGMTGAPALAAAAALRGGAGMVRVAIPGEPAGGRAPVEAVAVHIPEEGWVDAVLAHAERCHVVVIGPGLGLRDRTQADVRDLVARAPVPVVIDGDALTALGAEAAAIVRRRRAATVLTPHDGEAARLTGAPPGRDRFEHARGLAWSTAAVVTLKGPTTLIAEPDGVVHAVTTGDERLATAGTGDVLAGLTAALLARGAEPHPAASAAAWLHGRAAELVLRAGFVASDLLGAIGDARAAVERA